MPTMTATTPQMMPAMRPVEPADVTLPASWPAMLEL